MDGEFWVVILLIIGAVLGLTVFFTKRGKKTKTPPASSVTATVRTSAPGVRPPAATPPARTPVVRYPQNIPQPDPVIPIFEDRTVRHIRRCPSCDGENPIHAQICEICGRRL